MSLRANPQLEPGSSSLHAGRHMLPVAMVALLDINSGQCTAMWSRKRSIAAPVFYGFCVTLNGTRLKTSLLLKLKIWLVARWHEIWWQIWFKKRRASQTNVKRWKWPWAYTKSWYLTHYSGKFLYFIKENVTALNIKLAFVSPRAVGLFPNSAVSAAIWTEMLFYRCSKM